MTSSDHAAHTVRTVHSDDRVQFLVTGDESSLAEVELALAALPLCARGRVFLEVATADQIGVVTAPPRMIVTWLTRSRRTGGVAPGEAVSRAVAAWSAEMLCDGPGATRAALTGRYRAVEHVHDHLVETVGMSVEHVSVPDRFRLRSSH